MLQGRICHTIGDEDVIMEAGDAITVNTDIVHNARNIGETEAVLSIAFSSANRKTVGE